jgi:SAM-dependent methyltransferase
MTADRTPPRPLYHDFAWLGLPTAQLPGIYGPNQRAKAPVITAYILLAFAKLRCRGCHDISFAELFCADGFYTLFAARFGAGRAMGYDNDRDGHLASAERVRDLLGLGQASFHQTDIEAIAPDARASVVANVGGLYHVDDPEAVLDQSYRMAEDYLIVQNVVSLANDAPDYFERPAPGLTWGNRFSRASFDALIRRRGWKVVDSAFNSLDANPRPEDRGSLYYLIEK